MASNGFFSKEKFIDILNAKADMALGTPKQVFYSVVKMLEALPAADVVEVVRCKDCKHRYEYADFDRARGEMYECHECRRLSEDLGDDGFCSCGERKMRGNESVYV